MADYGLVVSAEQKKVAPGPEPQKSLDEINHDRFL